MKLGAELTDRSIATVLRIGEPKAGEILYRSFSKLKDSS